MTQQVKVWLDKNFLSTTKGSGELLTNLEKLNITTIIDQLPVENSIFWTRYNSNVDTSSKKSSNPAAGLNNEEVQHDHILVKLELECFTEYLNDFVSSDSVDHNTLVSFVSEVKRKAQVTQVTLLISGFKQYLKTLQSSKSDQKAKENYDTLIKMKKTTSKAKPAKLSKSEINGAIIHLELNEKCCIRSFDGQDELRDIVLSYTKSVSEYLSKHELNENLIFCDKSIDKSQAKISKDGQGFINVWKELIESFPLVSCEQAQAICAVYPSPLLLKKAYETSGSNGGMLLADIQVRRGAGVLSNVRRIGPELSQKIHKFFTATNPNELLVNE